MATATHEGKQIRVALYARVSTDEQKTDLQLDSLRALASQRGWHVVGEFVDHGVSGAKASRPQLNVMLREISQGHVDLVAVWKLDRLGRSTRDLLNLVEDLRVRNVGLMSAQESLDTQSATGRAFFTIVAMFGELEREWLRERTKAGVHAARRRGKRIGRPRASVDMVRARSLKASGKTMHEIADALGVGIATLFRAFKASEDRLSETCSPMPSENAA